jgi:hypothetical protein
MKGALAKDLTANLTATGLATGGEAYGRGLPTPRFLYVRTGGHDSMELKIRWLERAVRVRVSPGQSD